ncbi:putative transmembrane protein [Heterostelium album PN500]|uniref:Putative transmembrane protein n=1 Tax=Heterostelium pallidum (strain ATCC 26659 / Pp 5 / PN500) TaxID=670386 RepID=D3BRM3_HETP5|nr:putative transmembrane protein [Heterostelium album PN500]EFA76055.1 putative transmembrane protein [Heterostelium album PN500]|eukprot:XP_020428189.1 putative transmembrane protein [Heterostelium album PN500]
MRVVLLLVTLVLSVLAVSNATNLAAVEDFGGVVIGDVSKGAIRAYGLTQGLSGFTVSGLSLFGSVDDNSASVQADFNSFAFTGLQQCAYALSYNKIAANAGTGTGSVDADVLYATYFPSLIVEYEETDGGNGYQYGKDKLLGWSRLNQWGSIIPGVNNWDIKSSSKNYDATVNGKNYTFPIFQVNTTSPNNMVTFRFVIPGANVEINDLELSAEQTKIDIQINNYYDSTVNKRTTGCDSTDVPFSCDATGPSDNANSRLALISFFATLSAQASVGASGSNGVSTNGGAITAAFDWVTSVTINGTKSASVHTEVDVLTSGLNNQYGNFDLKIGLNGFANINANVLVQSFDAVRPSNVVWDPVLGGQANSASVVIPSIAVILVAIIALLF